MMDRFLYSMEHNFEKMKTDINNILNQPTYTEEDKNRIFNSVGCCLHFILDYAERKTEYLNKDDKEILDAFKYANNGLKHGIEIKEITEHVGGISFPIEFPLSMPERKIVWNVNWEPKSKNQKAMYKKHLDGIGVIESCENMIIYLKKISNEEDGMY